MADGLDAVMLARLQFAFTIAFHIVFPAITIGLASYLAVLEALWLWRGNEIYLRVFRFWLTPFALVFGMGVVSGVVMSYQFGTNWSVFADRTGPILGPLMGYEVMTAFFLEAGFLGIMLFGMQRVGPRLHFLATLMVAAGTLLSAFWILAANSWMHTPAGYAVNAVGQFVPVDWLAVIFNPSFPFRFVHMALAAYLATALLVGATAAWHLRRGSGDAPARLMLSMAMWMLLATAPLQIAAGDLHGLNTLEHQPAKIAALEGHFKTQTGAPLILLGWPDMAAGKTRHAVEIPVLGSLILTHSHDGEVPGLDAFPRADWPNAPIVFWSFRVMVGLGFLMLALAGLGLLARLRGNLFTSRGLHRFAIAMGPAGIAAILAGWVTTEVGRQPFTVYGLLRTSDSLSPVQAPAIATSLIAFVVVYTLVFGAGIFYILRMMRRGPDSPDSEPRGPQRAAGITPAFGTASDPEGEAQ
jgi:cytochrome d ubiquinol oxidase subunit I